MHSTTVATLPTQTGFEGLVEGIKEEFLEMPGLHLTGRQAARLLGIEFARCRAILDFLVAEGFLRHGIRGHYVRADDR
jgi:hypothetical protein